MSEITPELHPVLERDDDDVGEFGLPHLEPGALTLEDEHDQYDVQILGALISP